MDEPSDITLIDHIGVDLWAAAEAWKACYARAMVARGYGFFGEAGFAVLQHVGPRGARPAAIARRLGVSRQAVHQLVETLEKEGVVTRLPDPDDRRARIVRLTALGARAHAEGNHVKRQIDLAVAEALGADGHARLAEALGAVAALLKPGT